MPQHPSDEWSQYEVKPSAPGPKADEWSQYEVKAAPDKTPHPTDAWQAGHQKDDRSAISKFLVPDAEQERGYKEMAKGAVKGAVETVQGMSNMLAPKGSFWDTGEVMNTKSSNGYQTAGKVAEGIAEVAFPAALSGVIEKIPTAAKGAAKLNEVAEAAGQLPVKLSRTHDALMRAAQLNDTGASMPTPIKKLLKTYTAGRPILYAEARDFYSNLSHLSAKDNMALTPPMRRQLGLIVQAMKDDIGDTAAQVDKASTYYAGMRDYARAMKAGRIRDAIVGALKSKVLKYAVGAGAGYAAAKAIGKEF